MASSGIIGRPGRPSSPATRIVSRIGSDAPLFIPDSTDFAGYVQGQLGDLGTGTDGFDALFAIPAGSIDGDITALGDFDELLSSLGFNIGDFAGSYFAPIDALLPTFLSDGDALNATVQGLDLVTGTVQITTPPAPPIDLGGSTAGGGQPIDNGPGPVTGENNPIPPWDVPVSYYL